MVPCGVRGTPYTGEPPIFVQRRIARSALTSRPRTDETRNGHRNGNHNSRWSKFRFLFKWALGKETCIEDFPFHFNGHFTLELVHSLCVHIWTCTLFFLLKYALGTHLWWLSRILISISTTVSSLIFSWIGDPCSGTAHSWMGDETRNGRRKEIRILGILWFPFRILGILWFPFRRPFRVSSFPKCAVPLFPCPSLQGRSAI